MKQRCLLLALTTVLVVLPTAALAGGGSLCSGFGTDETVTMRDNCFSATALFASPGQKTTIVNEGAMEHSYTALDGSFDTGILQPGDTATVTAPDQGLVRVYCTIHSSRDGEGMAGVLLVSDDGGARTDATVAALASATRATAEVPAPQTTQRAWPVVGAALLAVAALAVALRANRRVTTALHN